MLNGHGDDLQRYKNIRINFSSNVYNHFNHDGLFSHLAACLPRVVNYPEPAPVSLESKLASRLDLNPNEVMVTNGATEAIYLIAQAFQGAASSILQPTFAEYQDACRMFGHRLDSDDEDMIWLCNPNNPTGLTIDRDDLLAIISENRNTTYVIDASYAAFTLEPLISPAEAARYPNILMLHSMTKGFAIPGLRLGYVTANATLLNKVKKGRMPWSVNQLALDAGDYLLDHVDEYQLDMPQLIEERKRVANRIAEIEAMEVMPSDSHILLCRTLVGTATLLKEYLALEHGILIRDASNFEGLDSSYFRIAVQTPQENDELIKALQLWTKQ